MHSYVFVFSRVMVPFNPTRQTKESSFKFTPGSTREKRRTCVKVDYIPRTNNSSIYNVLDLKFLGLVRKPTLFCTRKKISGHKAAFIFKCTFHVHFQEYNTPPSSGTRVERRYIIHSVIAQWRSFSLYITISLITVSYHIITSFSNFFIPCPCL